MQRTLTKTGSSLMLATAVLFDVVQALINLIPVVGQILSFFISIFAFMTFWLWFKMYGVSFSKGKNLKNLGFGFLIEMIPVVDILPAWTFAVFRLIAAKKLEDMTQNVPVAGKVIQMKEKTAASSQ